jgi:hypothetical protein
LKSKFTFDDIDKIDKSWLKNLQIPNDFKYKLAAYLNGDLGPLLWQHIPYQTNSEMKNIFNAELNAVLSSNSCKMQENLFTHI